jgi:hypothetical protein
LRFEKIRGKSTHERTTGFAWLMARGDNVIPIPQQKPKSSRREHKAADQTEPGRFSAADEIFPPGQRLGRANSRKRVWVNI